MRLHWQAFAMTLSPAFQESYQKRLQYPQSLVTSSTAIYSSKLKSYRRRIDVAEQELCLIDGQDDVNGIFEIPIIDLETDDGKGLFCEDVSRTISLTKCSVTEAIHPLPC
jgi:hypothetical protein